MNNIKIYVVIRYPTELIGVYKTLKSAKSAVKDYTNNNDNEDEFYIDCDILQE